MSLTQERLKALFDYLPETGEFYRKRPSSNVKAGVTKGSLSKALGYRTLHIDGANYYAHRLAWLYVYGELPGKGWHIDHINQDRADNRLVNLRCLTHSQNNHNRSDTKGVRQLGHKWEARIKIKNETHYLGRYETEQEARDAYIRAKRTHTEESHH